MNFHYMNFILYLYKNIIVNLMTIVCISWLKLQKFYYMVLRLVYGVPCLHWELLDTFFLVPDFVVMCNTYPPPYLNTCLMIIERSFSARQCNCLYYNSVRCCDWHAYCLPLPHYPSHSSFLLSSVVVLMHILTMYWKPGSQKSLCSQSVRVFFSVILEVLQKKSPIQSFQTKTGLVIMGGTFRLALK
jgi:hypothetical protein